MFPRFVFDAEKCYEGLEALKAYRREWSETKHVGDRPLHDWSSHASDALRCFAMGYGEDVIPDATRYYQLPPAFMGGASWQAG